MSSHFLTSAVSAPVENHSPKSPVRVLVRSSWQTVNIGDISHTPGLLRFLESHLPEIKITLLACDLSRGVGEMLRRQFPEVEIIESPLTEDGLPTTPEARRAWESADFYLHGSGPSIVARTELSAWAKTGRPYGLYGVTVEKFNPASVELLSGASFVFFRDTVSLRNARAAGVRMRQDACLAFAPDAAFSAADSDDTSAKAFLAKHQLSDRGYICVIPRLRYTPYYRIHNRPPTEQEKERDAINDAHRERDLLVLRNIASRWVRDTGLKVLLCPEMTYEVELSKSDILDQLPSEIAPQVAWRDTYWRNDEAVGVYAHAFAVVSIEMHSPILAFAAGTPAIHVRQPTDTCKGQMWRDIGLPEWIFEIDDTDGQDIADTLLGMWRHPAHTAAKLSAAREHVARVQALAAEVIKDACLKARITSQPSK